MSRNKKQRLILSVLLILALVLAGCGKKEAAPVVEEPAPLAQPLAQVEEAPATTEAPAPTEAPAAPAAPAAAEFDLVAAVDNFLSNIPEGYLAIGQVDKLKDLMEAGDVLLVDVREPAEVEKGVIPGAIHIPIRELAKNLDKIPTDRPVVTYCASGHRAGMAAAALEILGYDNVRAFPPSFKGWAAAGEPVDPAPAEPETFTVPEIQPELLEAVDGFLSNIPEGFYAIGTVEKLKDFMESADPLLVDVREPSEYAEGAIPGAINIPIRTLAKNLDQIPTDRPVVVYCSSGHRAAMSTAALHVLGYENVRSFPPSWKGWVAAQEQAAFDPVAAMDEFMASIPEGYWAIGTVDKLQELMDSTDVLLVDVREDAEVEAGVIPGAIHIPMRELLDNLDKIPTDRPVVTYCGSGHRAAMTMTVLQFLGYDNVRAFPPSWKGWTAAEMPTDPAPAQAETFPMPSLDQNKLAMAQAFLPNVPEGYYAIGTVEKLKDLMDSVDVTLVDVREDPEWEAGHIPGAVHVPLRTLMQNLDQIPKEQPVVTYCKTGHRAAMGMTALQMVGYDNARAFPPSFVGWSEAGEPVEK